MEEVQDNFCGAAGGGRKPLEIDSSVETRPRSLPIQEIIETIRGNDNAAWAELRAHYEQLDDPVRREAMVDACDHRDRDFIREHLFAGS